MRDSAVRVILLVAGAFFLVTGIWAFAAPTSFYDVVATYPPYNEHLFHDIGSFQIGIGVSAVAGVLWNSGIGVALVGGTAGAVAHAVSHMLDRDLGGRATDPLSLALFAGLLIVGLVLHLKRSAT